MRTLRVAAAVISIALLVTSEPASALPARIPVQGVLTSPSGTPLDGSFNVTFSIYDIATGGTPLHAESQALTVDVGIFTAYLGTNVPIDLAIFRDLDEAWLGISVGTDPEMTPRLRLGMVPFAAEAGRAALALTVPNGSVTAAKLADGAAGTAVLADGAVTSVKIADGAVATVDLAANAVTNAKIADGTITTADLADAAATSAKIADGAVATVDLAASAVTSAKIADGGIAAADLAPNSVTNSKLLLTKSLYTATSQSVDPTNVATGAHQFCALTQVAFTAYDPGTNRWCAVTADGDGTWTLSARAGGASATCQAICF